MKRTRLAGIAVTATIVATVTLMWSAGGPADRGSSAAPSRGGQLVASVRTEPGTFNRFVARDQGSELLSLLMQGRLVRINRATREVEPWLAERWETSDEGRTHTVHLRRDVVWSDGVPFTAADVVFSVQAVFDAKTASVLASSLIAAGEPIRATEVDTHTVTIRFAGPSGPGVRLLDNLPILPRHKLEAALAAGTLRDAWGLSTPPSELAGTGPFVLREYQRGQRVILERNPRYWRKTADGTPLPYLDRLVLEIIPDPATELLRLQAGEIHMIQDALRSEDFVAARRAESQGRLTMVELGVTPDADAFWFCLDPARRGKDPRFAFVSRPEFRQALSHAVDREAFTHTVFLGEGVPVWGPITPGNRDWFNPDVPRYRHDPARARELLASIGLTDRDGDGVVEDAAGTRARFTVLTQRGPAWYARGTTVLRESARAVGVELEIAFLDRTALFPRLDTCDFDAVYMRPLATDLDPAGNMDFWLSSGGAHFWHPRQKTPATAWEARIDALMLQQAATPDRERRRELFDEVQRILAENLPVLYFAAERMYGAHGPRVVGVQPSPQRPPMLWSADTIGLADEE